MPALAVTPRRTSVALHPGLGESHFEPQRSPITKPTGFLSRPQPRDRNVRASFRWPRCWNGPVPRITDDQHNLLCLIVDGYADVKEEFYFSTGMGIGTMMQQAGIGGRDSVDHGDIEELWDHGLIAVTSGSSPMSGRLRPTAEGIHHVKEARRLEAIARADDAISSVSGTSRIAWGTTLPVLQAVVDLYAQADAGEDVSQMQVNQRLEREDGDSDTSRAFEVLERSEYVQATASIEQLPGALTVVPTERALQLLEGWPGDGEVALARLIAALQTQIDATVDEDEKGKVRRVLDAVQGVGENVAAEVLTKVMMGG